MTSRKEKITLILTTLCLTATVLTGCENPAAKTLTTSTTSPQVNQITDGQGTYADTTNTKSNAETNEETTAQLPDESKIVRDVNATLTSRDFEEADKQLSELVKQYSARTTTDNYESDYDTHELTYHVIDMRVESEKLNDFIEAIKSGDKWSIQTLNTSADDIGDQYQTNKEQIESLRIRYDFYKKQAESATDEQAIQSWTDKMLDTMSEIQQLENQNSQINTDVAYSTVSIILRKDIGAESVNTSNGVWQTLLDTLTMLPTNILAAFGQLLIVIVWLLPYGLIIALIIFIARIINKKYREKHPKPEPKPIKRRTNQRKNKQQRDKKVDFKAEKISQPTHKKTQPEITETEAEPKE